MLGGGGIMQTVTVKDHDYQGQTIQPHGETIARLNHQFQNVKGPEQLRKVLKAWGLREVSPRQARFWADCLPREKRVFCDMANVSVTYSATGWQAIPEPQRRKLWQAIGDAAAWGERLRGRW